MGNLMSVASSYLAYGRASTGNGKEQSHYPDVSWYRFNPFFLSSSNSAPWRIPSP